jgi:hypothetical protein
VQLADSIGLILDDWQRWWLEHALAERADGKWCAADTVLITGRQSGKNVVLAALELWALFVNGEHEIVHSAHELPTALNHMEFMLALIDGSPDLSKKCLKPVTTNGREAIRTRAGGRLKFRARMNNSGRGLTAARIVFDEAFKISPSAMGSLIPTTRAMPNRQFTYASSAPKSDSHVLHSLIRRGRDDDPEDRIFYAEWGNPVGTPLSDEDAWCQANPALGSGRVTIDNLRDEYRTLVAGGDDDLIAEFAREAVGIGEEDAQDHPDPKMDPAAWAATVANVAARDPVKIAFDVEIDGTSAAIVAASGSLGGEVVVDVIDVQKGTGWLPARIVELVKAEKPSAVGCNGAGPAGALVGPVQMALRAAELDIEVTQLNQREYAQACGGFALDVQEGRLRRPHGQQPLDLAGENAAERALSESWAWARRKATVPIAPLVAATIARALLPVEEPEPSSPLVFVVS